MINIHEVINNAKINHQIFHDLMKFKIKEILMITTAYDAYIIEQEDLLTEKIFGEYYQLNLSNAPRITSVSSEEEALKILKNKKIDLVILTLRVENISPFEISEKIKKVQKKIPVILLLNNNSDILMIENKSSNYIDNIFVWNGDPSLFLAMNKCVEDKLNVDEDTKSGMVRIILLVEDSIKYYSRYLPNLYTQIIIQTQRLIKQENLDDSKKLLRMRSRPKVIIANNYEDAVEIFEKYKNFILCIISDMKYEKDGIKEEFAGKELIKYVKKRIPDLPALLQSSEESNRIYAEEIGACFINKNSESLSLDLKNFIVENLGFGDFVFRDKDGKDIARAKSLNEFKTLLKTIPDEVLLYHGKRNHFSSWLMAHGEIIIAKKLKKAKFSSFKSVIDIRKYLIKICNEVEKEKTKGQVINFDSDYIKVDYNIVKLYEGSLGGKGRGIAFLNSLLNNLYINKHVFKEQIKLPETVIIGTKAYEEFIEINNLTVIIKNKDFDNFENFKKTELPEALKSRLKIYLDNVDYPIAVRSSGIFEDSLYQPFSGIYKTFMLPNNNPSIEIRQKQLEEAIKAIYFSVFSKIARTYFEAIHYKIEEEKMAIILQKVVGNKFDDIFYPHISGVAQSYNYYPFSYIKPQDGISMIALGLGSYVVEGEKAFRFCPKYPKLDIQSQEDILKNTQKYFYAINLKDNDIDISQDEQSTIVKLQLNIAEKNKSISKLVSVWDNKDNILKPGIFTDGPRILNFANILKYNLFPLSEILVNLLDFLSIAVGTPVEIEFAVDLEDPATFYILQLKPFHKNIEELNININFDDKKNMVLYSNKSSGNGKINNINDIIYVDPESFDKTETLKITDEIEKYNEKMKSVEKKYILIGPGRWGTRDRFLGIPVKWDQISNAVTIIEFGLKGFQIENSQGSHFFHNITSMNIGYFSVDYNCKKSFINWEWLKKQKESNNTKFVHHISYDKGFEILMNGKKGIAAILY